MQGFPGGSDSKETACNAGDPGSISGSGRSPGEGNGNPLQHSCLENSMDREAWWATGHEVTELDTTEGLTHTSVDLQYCYTAKWFKLHISINSFFNILFPITFSNRIFLFNWSTVALQCYVSFCSTTTGIKLKEYIYPLPLELPSHPPHPIPLGHHSTELSSYVT